MLVGIVIGVNLGIGIMCLFQINRDNKLQIENKKMKRKIKRAIDILECSSNMFAKRGLSILKGDDSNE